jgi:hypothetical protein
MRDFNLFFSFLISNKSFLLFGAREKTVLPLPRKEGDLDGRSVYMRAAWCRQEGGDIATASGGL